MSYSQHAGFFGTTRTLLSIVGFEGMIRQANTAWGHALGYAWEEIASLGFIDLLHPDDQTRVAEEMEKFSQGGIDPVVFTAGIRHCDGHYLEYLWEVTPALMEFAFYAVGMPAACCLEKAQAQFQAEQNEDYVRLQEKHADLELMYQDLQTQKGLSVDGNSPAIVESILSHINEAILIRQSGGAPRTLTPRQTELIFGGLPSADKFATLWKLAQGTAATDDAVHYTLKANQKRVALLGDTVHEADSQAPPAQLLIVSDIHEQHVFKHSLHHLQEEYGLFTAKMQEALLDWNLVNQTVKYSPSWQGLLGCEQGIMGHQITAWQDRIHPADHEHVMRALRSCVGGQSKKLEIKHRVQHSDGSYRWLYAVGDVTVDKSNIKHFVISFVDVTRERELELQITLSKKS